MNDATLDFVLVSSELPEAGQEVEVIRNVYYHGVSGYMRYCIERTTHLSSGVFTCDVVSTGAVVAWRPAEPFACPSEKDYAFLKMAIENED